MLISDPLVAQLSNSRWTVYVLQRCKMPSFVLLAFLRLTNKVRGLSDLQAYKIIEHDVVTDQVFSQFIYKIVPDKVHMWTFKKQLNMQMALSGSHHSPLTAFCVVLSHSDLPTRSAPVCLPRSLHCSLPDR